MAAGRINARVRSRVFYRLLLDGSDSKIEQGGQPEMRQMDKELKGKLSQMPDSPDKADMMTKMAAEMSESRPSEAAELCREALAISNRISFVPGRDYALGILSFCEIVLASHR